MDVVLAVFVAPKVHHLRGILTHTGTTTVLHRDCFLQERTPVLVTWRCFWRSRDGGLRQEPGRPRKSEHIPQLFEGHDYRCLLSRVGLTEFPTKRPALVAGMCKNGNIAGDSLHRVMRAPLQLPRNPKRGCSQWRRNPMYCRECFQKYLFWSCTPNDGGSHIDSSIAVLTLLG